MLEFGAPEVTTAPVENQTLLFAASFVCQVIWTLEVVTLVALKPEITGAVWSGVGGVEVGVEVAPPPRRPTIPGGRV